MRTDSPVIVRRQDYRPPAWLVDRIDLAFDLDPRRTRVVARSTLRPNPIPGGALPDLVLDGDGLVLVEVAVADLPLAPQDFAIDAHGLTIRGDVLARLGAAGEGPLALRVVTEIDPQANTALSGLYLSGGNFFTQCEAEGFRRITYFPDRPDVMARYRVTMRAQREACPVLLSNGNLVSERMLPASEAGGVEDMHEAVWEDPFPKPSYLFALVAGRLSVGSERRLRTLGGKQSLLQVWVEPGDESRTGHAMDSLERAIRWDERRFGLELDLERFMIVAVGDFNMGAMENKGLNVFNTKYVFADPRVATDADYANVESVVGHEYFHNWTGNRVTCRDWFQLTLKEGLTVFRDQEFSADMLAEQAASPAAAASARAVKRIDDVRVLRTAQFPEDAGPMAHPIRPDAYQEINNFYTVTVYEKGGEVIRMLQTLVGRDGFRKGMDLYFQRHDGQAVTCDDFVAAIADANARDLSLFSRWYAQAGTPRVEARGRWDAAAGTWTLTLRQMTPATPGQPEKLPLHIPFAIGLLGPDGKDLPLRLQGDAIGPEASATDVFTRVLDLTASEQRFVFVGLPAEPVPSLLRDFSAPVVVDHPYTDAQLAFLLAHDADPFNRWEASQRLGTAAVLGMLLDESDAGGAATLHTLAEGWKRALGDPSLEPAYQALVLTLPSEGFVAEQLAEVDPGAVRAARDRVRRRLGALLAAQWQAALEANATPGPYSPDATSAGKRALAQLALSYLAGADDGTDATAAVARQAQQRAFDLFSRADNMTDRLGSLGALLVSDSPLRDRAFAAFETELRDEPLAMDKWFSLQATMHRMPGDAPVVERVRALLSHPLFSLRNPNRVRALVGSFCNGNLAEFHAEDGSGYALWVEHVLALDAINPQVASRLARALDRWRKFTPERRAAMQAALERVHAEAKSNDVLEVVGKALG